MGNGRNNQTQDRMEAFGERNGNPLQYSCLENPMDRGAWYSCLENPRDGGAW